MGRRRQRSAEGPPHSERLQEAGAALDLVVDQGGSELDKQVDLQLTTGASVFSAYYDARIIDKTTLPQSDKPKGCSLDDHTRDVVYKVDQLVTAHVAQLWAVAPAGSGRPTEPGLPPTCSQALCQ